MKNFIKFLVLTSIITSLSGCVTPLTPEEEEVYNKPVYCNSKDECGFMWEKATFFINQNSSYAIRVLNDSMIETYSPSNGNTWLGYRVLKQPLGHNKYNIIPQVWCDNPLGCNPDKQQTIVRFKKYLMAPAG